MNDPNLRDLFTEALSGEPETTGLPDDDVARGRALRSRRMRRRAGGAGGGVVALLAAALVVPASPLSLTDSGPDPGQPATTTSVLTPDVANDPLKLEMWKAVDDVLPDEVRLAEESYVHGSGYGTPGISMVLERADQDDHQLRVSVNLEHARPDLEEFRPCSDPNPALGEWSFDERCEENHDADGRWRISAEMSEPARGVTVLEGETAATIVSWSEIGFEVDGQGAITSSAAVILTADQIDAVADATLSVGSQRDGSELFSGIDLTATLEIWPEMHTTLEEELDMGPLTPVPPEEVATGATIDEDSGAVANIDERWQSGTIAARYQTEDGIPIDVIVWQKDRMYETFCHDQIPSCDVMDGMSVGRADDAPDTLVGPGVNGSLGSRSGLYVLVGTGELVNPEDPEDAQLDAKVSAAQVELTRMVPFLGDERHPIPEGI